MKTINFNGSQAVILKDILDKHLAVLQEPGSEVDEISDRLYQFIIDENSQFQKDDRVEIITYGYKIPYLKTGTVLHNFMKDIVLVAMDDDAYNIFDDHYDTYTEDGQVLTMYRKNAIINVGNLRKINL